MEQKIKIVMLVGEAKSSTFMYNGLSKDFVIEKVVRETPVSMKQILKNRAKRLGYFNVFGQILFGVLLLPIIRKFSKNKLAKVLETQQLDSKPIPESKIISVKSVNSNESLKILKELNADVIVVNGCRIISKKILNNVSAKFINTHEGITTKYRGIHGCYWALVNKDKENCGVTVHFVDAGVDTGEVLYQATVNPTKNDNFTTYPFYQTAKGIELMKLALNDVNIGTISPKKGVEGNYIWYHPTIWQYLYYRIFRGVK